jgi:hypothetical protein
MFDTPSLTVVNNDISVVQYWYIIHGTMADVSSTLLQC